MDDNVLSNWAAVKTNESTRSTDLNFACGMTALRTADRPTALRSWARTWASSFAFIHISAQKRVQQDSHSCVALAHAQRERSEEAKLIKTDEKKYLAAETWAVLNRKTPRETQSTGTAFLCHQMQMRFLRLRP